MSHEQTPVNTEAIIASSRFAEYERASQEIIEQNQAAEAAAAAEKARQEAMAAQEAERKNRIEARRRSPEVQKLNDEAVLELFGSQGETLYDTESGKVIASPESPIIGKYEQQLTYARRVGEPVKRAEALTAAEKIKADFHELLAEGFEPAQAKLVMDLREERSAVREQKAAELKKSYKDQTIAFERELQDVTRYNGEQVNKYAAIEVSKNPALTKEQARKLAFERISAAEKQRTETIERLVAKRVAGGESEDVARKYVESKMPTASILKKRPEEPKRYGLIDAKDEDWSTRQAIKRDGVFSKAEYKQKYGEYRPAVKQVAEAAPRKAVNTEKQPKAPKNNGGKGNGKPESAEKKSNGDNKRAKQAKGNSSVAPETSSKPSDAEAEQLAQPEPTTEEELTAEQKADRDYKAFLEGLSDSEYADVEKLNVYIGKNHLDGSSFKTNDLFGNALGTTQEGRVLDFAKYKEALQHMAATGVLVSDKDTHNNGTPRTYRISPELLEQLRNQATSAQPVGETAATQVAPESTEPAASTSREQVAAANTEPLQTAATETVPAPTADAETAIDGLSPEQQDKISIWLSEYNSQLKPGQGVSLRRIRSAMKRDGIKVKAETLDKLLRTFEDPDSLIRYESYENHGVPYYRRPNEPSRSTARTNAAEQTTAVQAPVQTAEATREPVASPAAEHVADDKMQAFFNQLPDSRERTDFKYIHMFLMRRLRKGQFEGGTLDDWFEHERKGSTITKEHAQRYLDLLAADPSVPIVKNTDGSNGSTYRLDGSAVAQTQEAPRILGFDAEEETPRQRQPESRLSRRERVRRLGQRAVAFDRRSQELVTTFGKKVYKHEPWYKARNLAKEDGRQVAEERAQRERDEAERERIERERRAA